MSVPRSERPLVTYSEVCALLGQPDQESNPFFIAVSLYIFLKELRRQAPSTSTGISMNQLPHQFDEQLSQLTEAAEHDHWRTFANALYSAIAIVPVKYQSPDRTKELKRELLTLLNSPEGITFYGALYELMRRQ